MFRLKLWLIGAAVAVLAVAAVAFTWRNSLITGERARAATDAARDFRSTTERIGDADVGKGDADDDLRWLDDRLRALGGQR